MRAMKQVLVLTMAGGMLAPALSAQSIWQRMKQSAQQAERNAQAQQRQRQAQSARTNGSTSATAATRNTQSATADSPAAAAPVNVDSSALKALNRKLDVGGVWLGMPAGAAQAAILKRNPKLTANPHHFGFAETPQTLFTDVIGFERQGETYTGLQNSERMQLQLTLQPMPSEVASIQRDSMYNETSAPTMASTVEALHAKYGQESIILPKDATGMTAYVWIFDGSGRQVKISPEDYKRFDAFNLVTACGEGNGGNVLQMLKATDYKYSHGADCSTYTALAANLTEWQGKLSNGQTMPPGVLRMIDVSATSFPLLSRSTDATRNMLIAARKGEQQQKKNALNKNVPTL